MIDKRFDHIENYNYKFFMDLFYNSGLTQNRKILENIQKFTKNPNNSFLPIHMMIKTGIIFLI
jgi:hypothetical protein